MGTLEQLRTEKQALQTEMNRLYNKKVLLELSIRSRYDEELIIELDELEKERRKVYDEMMSYNEKIEIAYKKENKRRK